MKKWNKAFLIALCLCMVLGMTACGSRNNGINEGTTDQTVPEQNNMDTNTPDNVGNAVDDGIDNVGNAIDDGMNAVGDGIDNIADDLTGDSAADNTMNDATENTRTRTMN